MTDVAALFVETYTNYDGVAIGVQFFGIGDEHVAAHQLYKLLTPSTVLALIAELKLAREVVKAARGRHEEWTRKTYIAIDEALKNYDRLASRRE